MKRTFLIRFAIVIFWVGIIFLILQLPQIHFNPKKQKTLNIFTWSGIFHEDLVHEFEKETNIKVHLSYYTSNEELFVKLCKTQGEGYDLVVPSDYAVKILLQNGLLKRFDTSKILRHSQFLPKMLNLDYDPGNRYSLPIAWEVFGIGIDAQFFDKRPLQPSWGLLFDKEQINYRIAMTNDPVEAINCASFYLYGPKTCLTKKELKAVSTLLIQQKEWIEAYAGIRADILLATKNCEVAFTPSSYIYLSQKEFPDLEFVLPEKGTYISIENVAIPKGSTHEKEVYQFLNFMLRPEHLKKMVDTYALYPPIIDKHKMQPNTTYWNILNQVIDDQHLIYFFRNLTTEEEMRDMWVQIKS